jgi:lipopolysaccharide transport system ATP-binding protein
MLIKPVITFDHVSKRYRRYGQKNLRQALSDFGRHLLPGSAARAPENQWLWAVRDLHFEIPPGRTVGIIGPNGAGKTTTLKLLSRITQPTTGHIKVSGRISALIELGAGFHPDLTGRENVFLNGTILGMRRQEIVQQFDAIVEFAELARFIDTPVKYYSSGMYARLGFAVAAHTNPDVLLVDEVLAVGDYSFQQRCYSRMRALQEQGTTILLVSHNLTVVGDICSEVIVLNQGQSVFQGPSTQAIAEYANLIRRPITSRSEIQVGQDGIGQRIMTHGAQVADVQLVDQAGRPVKVVASGEWVKLLATIEFHEDAPQPVFACFVRDERGQLIYDQTTVYQGALTPNFVKGQRATVIYELQMNLVEGIYNIGIDLAYQDLRCYYDRLESAISLMVDGGNGGKGIADLRCHFCFPDEKSHELPPAKEEEKH